MRLTILLVIILAINFSTTCQTTLPQAAFNFGFEEIENGKPRGWDISGSKDYQLYLDSTNVKSGKYAAVFQYDGASSDFKGLGFGLPANYEGDTITLTGYNQ